MATITGRGYLQSKKSGKTKNDNDYLILNVSEKVMDKYITYKFTLWGKNAQMYENVLQERDKSSGKGSSFVAFSGYIKGIDVNTYQEKTYTSIELNVESFGIIPPKNGDGNSSQSEAPKPVDLTDF